jgi:hypothetical protein
MHLQFQVYGTTTSAPRTIGLTSAKGEIQQVILLKTHVAFFALSQMSVCILICVNDVYTFVFINYELQELVIQLRA